MKICEFGENSNDILQGMTELRNRVANLHAAMVGPQSDSSVSGPSDSEIAPCLESALQDHCDGVRARMIDIRGMLSEMEESMCGAAFASAGEQSLRANDCDVSGVGPAGVLRVR